MGSGFLRLLNNKNGVYSTVKKRTESANTHKISLKFTPAEIK